MKIYSNQGVELLDIQVDDSSVRYRSIMGDESLTLKFSHINPVAVPVGSYVDFEGQRYTLWLPENFKKHNTRNFEYAITLGGWREALKLFKFKDLSGMPYRLKFSLTAKPIEFVQLIVDNMNIHSSGWTIGSCIDAVERTLSFNHEYCLDVTMRVAQEWKTEVEFEGKKIHLRKVEKFKDAPLALSYGKGNGFKSGVGRANDGDKQPIGRLYVQGGERNIDFSTYGSSSLLLPKGQILVYEDKTYRTDTHGMFITRDGNDLIAEDSFDANHIYPKRVGTVSEVIEVDAEKHFYDIKDASIPELLDYSACRIDGEKSTISFQSGALSGREFDIEQTDKALTGYIHEERRFKIVPQELDGIVMPGGIFVPAVGDAYAIFNISMPESYIADNATKTGASWEMFEECVKYFAINEKQKFHFTGELDGIWAKSKWLEIGGKIVPGGHVNFSDTQFLPNGEVIRITAVKDYVNFPHKPEITLSNAPISGGFNSQLGDLEAGEVVIEDNFKKGQLYTKRRWRDLMETMGMLEQSLLDFDPSISPVTIRTMQLIAGDESLQYRFVNNTTAPVRVNHSVVFDKETKVLTAESGIIQHMTMGISTVSPSHKANEHLYWDMERYISPPLDPKKSYYLYAKCDKSGNTGSFVLSETPIEMNGFTFFYHLLMGVVGSESDGERSIVMLYGFTEILPGRITTDKIISADGTTYFDLANNVIGGKIRFLNTDGDLEDIEKIKLYLQYSADAVNWHDAYVSTDRYMRQKNGANGTWSVAMAIGGDGRGISHIKNAFTYSPSNTSPNPNSGWQWTIANLGARPSGYFLWMRDDIFYTDGTDNATDGRLVVEGKDGDDAVAPIIIDGFWAFWNKAQNKFIPSEFSSIGDDGHSPKVVGGYWHEWDSTLTPPGYRNTWIKAEARDGDNGTDGISITATIDYYGLSNNKDILPTSWLENVIPTKGANQFLWNYEKITYSRGNPTTTTPRVIVGKDARGISHIKNAFTYSPSNTSPNPNQGWVYDISTVTRPAGYFLWMRDDIFYTDGTDNATDGRLVVEGKDAFVDPETIAKINQSAAITDQLGTAIDGGLITSVMMFLREANTLMVTAGISGIQGMLKDNPAVWAGGTYAQALAVTSFLMKIANGDTPAVGEYEELAKIALLHSGGAKVGDFIVEESGRIMMIDPTTGNERLVFSSSPIPSIDELMGTSVWGGSVTLSGTISGYTTETILAANIIVEKDNTDINFTAWLLEVTATADFEAPGGGPIEMPFATARIELHRNYNHYLTLGEVTATPNFGQSATDNRYNINRTVKGCPKGTYRVLLTMQRSSTVLSSIAGVTSGNLEWGFKRDEIRRIQIGQNGLMAFFENFHIHATAEKGLSIRGKIDIPGLLASGEVNIYGVQSKTFGPKVNTSNAYKGGAGDFTVYHSVGHTNYTVAVTAHAWYYQSKYRGMSVGIHSKTSTSFKVYLTDYGGSPQDVAFDYKITGDNY